MIRRRHLSIILYNIIVVLGFISCSKDTSIDNRVDRESLRLISFRFLAQDNPNALVNDVSCEIIGDSIVECWLPNISLEKKLLKPEIYAWGGVYIDDNIYHYRESVIDFKKPVKLTLKNEKSSKEYIVFVHSLTGLPVIWIETGNRKEIDSKVEYVNAKFKMIEDVVTRSGGDVIETDVMIRGRGNSTWTKLPKKPYRLKFNQKVMFLDMPEDKSWNLLANYADKTMLRNSLTFYLGNISNLDYTPRSHFVELMLNGKYNGTYQLTEKVKQSKDRVDVGKDGYVLLIDTPDDGDFYFTTNHLPRQVCVKEPEIINPEDDNFKYIKDYILNSESVLFSESFRDKYEGWQKYLDISSFVDYYLIQEITKNTDGALNFSCYMNLERGGKLKLGPLWDFDLAYGNYSGNLSLLSPEGLWIKNAEWFSRLFQDPVFVAMVKERFGYFYKRKDDIVHEINASAQYLSRSAIENNYRWNVLYNETWPNNTVLGTYESEVQWLKDWLLKRMEWLKATYDAM